MARMNAKKKKRIAKFNDKLILVGICSSSASFRSIANAETSSKVACWTLVLSLLLQLVSGERGALLRMEPGGVVVQGSYSRSGPDGLNATGVMRMIINNCIEEKDETNSLKKGQTDSDANEEEWVGVFCLPPLEESAGNQGGTGCSLLEQVKQAMLFGASALLILALNPCMFKEIESHLLTEKPLIIISDVQEVKKIQKTRKSNQIVHISAKPESTSKMKTVAAPKLTLWSTCGRSSGGSKFREWEGTVCLDPMHSTPEQGIGWIWRMVLSFIISYYILTMLRGMAQNPQQSDNEELEETLQRLARQSVSKMPVWKYKRKKYQQSADSAESCAVCLDDFYKGQTIRMLPCHHQFHNKCVDCWLIRKRTCPLCKLDIIDQRFGWGKKC